MPSVPAAKVATHTSVRERLYRAKSAASAMVVNQPAMLTLIQLATSTQLQLLAPGYDRTAAIRKFGSSWRANNTNRYAIATTLIGKATRDSAVSEP